MPNDATWHGMREYRLSAHAASDLSAIADYTFDRFGTEQTQIYRKRLFEVFEILATYPGIGTDWSRYRRGARRFAHESHVIYYRATRSGVLILRILSTGQDPARHL